MTDRELLELAAKAVGITTYWAKDGQKLFRRDGGIQKPWNPLNDDGDALRLAVKLQTPLMFSNEIARCVWGYGSPQSCVESVGSDPFAATRRAIVLAAAEIGKRG